MIAALALAAVLATAAPSAHERPCTDHGGAIEGVSNYRLRTFTLVCADGHAFTKPMRRGAHYRPVEPGERVFWTPQELGL